MLQSIHATSQRRAQEAVAAANSCCSNERNSDANSVGFQVGVGILLGFCSGSGVGSQRRRRDAPAAAATDTATATCTSDTGSAIARPRHLLVEVNVIFIFVRGTAASSNTDTANGATADDDFNAPLAKEAAMGSNVAGDPSMLPTYRIVVLH